jgi:hypothetical protein
MPGFDNGVMFADNVDFTGTGVSFGSAQVTQNGQLLIGSAVAPKIRVGTLGSSDGSITWTVGNGTITGQVTGGSTVGQTITGDSGGALSPTAGNWNILGSGSITTSGSGSTLTTALTGLTNHAVLVGAGTSTITKIAATANTGAVLQNNSGADPSYSTATYPSTTTINQILYSSANNTVTGLATANRAVLTTSATGVPQATALATDGQLIIGSTAGAPAAATLTQGTGITITNASNSITIAVNGSVVGETITGDSGGALSPTAGNWNILGQPSGSTQVVDTIGSGSTLKVEDRTWQTEYVVDASSTAGLQGTFTTIQSAINAAAADGTSVQRVKTIFVRKGTYTENLTMPANSIHITANTPSGYFSVQTSVLYDVTIAGNITFTAGAVAHFSNLNLVTSDTSAPINNSNAINVLNLTNCILSTTGGTNSLVNSSTVSNQIRLNNIYTLANISSSDSVYVDNSLLSGLTITGGQFIAYNTTIAGTSTFSTSGVGIFYNCILGATGAPRTFTINTNTLSLFGCSLLGNLTFNGTGTIKYGNCTYESTSSIFASTTVTPLTTSNDAIHVTTPGAYPYTTTPNDALILVDTSSARTITPLNSPTKGQMHIIKDNVGSAASNNITITPSAANIDGAASSTINVNYGSVTIVYNGTQWNIV